MLAIDKFKRLLLLSYICIVTCFLVGCGSSNNPFSKPALKWGMMLEECFEVYGDYIFPVGGDLDTMVYYEENFGSKEGVTASGFIGEFGKNASKGLSSVQFGVSVEEDSKYTVEELYVEYVENLKKVYGSPEKQTDTGTISTAKWISNGTSVYVSLVSSKGLGSNLMLTFEME